MTAKVNFKKGVYVPNAGIDWRSTVNDPFTPIVITDDPLTALELCIDGQPAIAVVGSPQKDIKEMLKK